MLSTHHAKEGPAKKPMMIVLIAVIAAAVVCGVLAFRRFHSDSPLNDLRSLNIEDINVGDTFTFGSYEQDNDYSNGSEPIEWQVLAIENGRMLVISKYGLDAQPYNTEYTDVTWETCSLRSWLNGTFYNTAFNSQEQAMITAVTIRNDDNPDYGTRGGNDTTDRIFLLSINEAYTYFGSHDERCCRVTEYTRVRGAYVNGQFGYYIGNSYWWLRSPGDNSDYAASVIPGGSVDSHGDTVDFIFLAVRPAMWIDLGETYPFQ